ncbi:MAG TPA: hypothetical protein VG435_20195, partial [Acidimicrobiales bacterium]|nr:hypothetical protein [Acidimicrobiales bacterium]
TPHVDYLRTSLTEMRNRTFLTTSGSHLDGSLVIGTLWDKLRVESMGTVEEANRASFRTELTNVLDRRPGGADLLEEFDALGEWKPAVV